ncbi:hypothetical protein IVB55_35545 [Bradyrhizobium sp. CW4]|uniref:hypothetical protein n=1 Tax=Bradyrhizobium sp. CW4 TaxID=2782687 RepID=UPI001FFB1D60|nr:hypothetical protein [Bradyrhizobium sp. CW4]MCK1418145.1 hypothetical protein [Bradyrhizobium sp. CW4]
MCFSISRRNSTLNWYLLNVIRLLRTVRRGADERTVSIQKAAPAGRVLWGNIWQWCCIEVIALARTRLAALKQPAAPVNDFKLPCPQSQKSYPDRRQALPIVNASRRG